MIISPVVVGSGKRFLPDGERLDRELLEARRFRNGAVVLLRLIDVEGWNVTANRGDRGCGDRCKARTLLNRGR
jgi:hypothetical protein